MKRIIIGERTVIIKPVDLHDQQVSELVSKLDKYQIELYGIEHCNLDSLDVLRKDHAFMLGAYSGDILIGIGAVKLFDHYAEVKRMFLKEKYHGSGIASSILTGLEQYAKQQKRKQMNLETGHLQQAAICFYQKAGYSVIEKFGAYERNPVSIYLSKKI